MWCAASRALSALARSTTLTVATQWRRRHLELVLLEPRPLLRADARGLGERLECCGHVLAGAALGADVVCPARVVTLWNRLDLQDAAQAGERAALRHGIL